ncbi:hypothetical protein PVK06_020101 [Gossypium arboreum]|uniref:Uncharacterized protein n=1 Tax=Gossypium arboreum TaxID=29729 RepID=A0ABR0PLK0_GOSAR|nr:hypothetical protein PVK06_020101 [Gossypium arboreum]
MTIFWANVEKRDGAMKGSLQKNFTKPMLAFPKFRKKLQEIVEQGMPNANSAVAEPGTNNSIAKEKETTSPDKDIEKAELVHIETDDERTEEANLTPIPLEDSTAGIPPTFTKPMTERDLNFNRLIDEITKSENEDVDVPLELLKRKICYKHLTRKSTRQN